MDSAPAPTVATRDLDRRRFMAYFSAVGLGGTLLPGVLWARSREAQEVTTEIVADAERVAGLEFTEEEREMMLRGLGRNLESFAELREVEIPNEVPPALAFDPLLPGLAPAEGWAHAGGAAVGGRAAPAGGGAGADAPAGRAPDRPFRPSRPQDVRRPADLEEVAFWPVTHLSELVRSGRVSSVELTEMYLRRLERHGPLLEAVVTLTPERALEKARRADAELAAGRWRGPLHGIPWGAKDLLSVRGYPTTWGARPFEDREIDVDATVVERLDEAGAVLVAKLTLGALAMGDRWFGGTTRNPWNLEQGSSGSSAGSAAATVAGLVGFSIGSETLGSIVSPSTRTGATGLRPTFGRVSRWGAMALSWSMDKLGPICRSAEDCALVLRAIHGADGRDPTARTLPFGWDAERALEGIRVGYLEGAFEGDDEGSATDRATLETLRGLGIEPVPVRLPDEYPLGALRIILTAEAAAAFDELTRSGRDEMLVAQEAGSWPNTFRTARMIPAVEYIQANRVRTMLMRATERALEGVDVLLSPSFAGGQLLLTNLTGHPAVVLPHGFTDEGAPRSFTFVGRLYGEEPALRVAKAFQDATDFHTRRPPRFV